MPGEKSHQHKLDRVRPPRVQITYDVETLGSEIKKELPFVLGVMADLAGHPDPDKKKTKVKERYFTEINRDTFSTVMSKIEPRLAMKVDNTLQNDGSKIGVELKFNTINDFEPEKVVGQVKPLRELLEIRRKLADLKTKAVSNDNLDTVLQNIIKSIEELKKRKDAEAEPTTTGEA